MFKKLLSNLPFNPSLINQVSFYSRRLKRESVVRRTGFVFIALTMLVQFSAVAWPPQSSLADSDNDLISGGITSQQGAVDACRQNIRDYGVILGNYGITCDDVASSNTVTVPIKSTDYDNKLFSMGHKQYNKPGETPVTINGNTVYLRPLSSFDTHGPSSYKALRGTAKNGQLFFILYSCGNLVFVGIPAQTDKQSRGSLDAVNCDLISGWAFDESVGASPIRVHIYIDGKLSLDTLANGSRPDVGSAYPGMGNNHGFSVATPASIKDSGQHTITAYAIGVDASGALNGINPPIGTLVVTLSCKTPPPPPPTDVCPGKAGVQTTIEQCDVCSDIPGIQLKPEDCKPCEASTSNSDKTACLVFHKTARNITQNLANVNGTTAKAGDVVEYTLSVTNKSKVSISYSVTDNFSDVLDYSDVTEFNGAKLDAEKNITWPSSKIPAGQTVKRVVVVKIKSPIPDTPVSASDPGHFDLTLVNVYGDAVTIKLPPSVVKRIETTTTTLPNTGPGTSLAIGFGLTAVVGYFFARSRLFATELDIVRQDYAADGGT